MNSRVSLLRIDHPNAIFLRQVVSGGGTAVTADAIGQLYYDGTIDPARSYEALIAGGMSGFVIGGGMVVRGSEIAGVADAVSGEVMSTMLNSVRINSGSGCGCSE